MSDMLESAIARPGDLESPAFRRWRDVVGEYPRDPRKLWDYCYVTQALAERDMLRPGRRGLGFAVGHEPMSALFASLGCEILATDQPAEQAYIGWIETGPHAADLEAVTERRLCEPARFRQQVRFRAVDMNHIPDDLRGFDFLWSAGSFEHLGSHGHGLRFVENSLRCLRPGGVAVHTTELNLGNDDGVVLNPVVVLYGRTELEALADRLRAQGHAVAPLVFDIGHMENDWQVNQPPMYLKLRREGHVFTSIGLIISKRARPGRVGRAPVSRLIGAAQRRVRSATRVRG